MKNKLTQNQIDWLKDQVRQKNMTAEQANVKKVKMARFELIKNSLPRDVRKALNAAVKSGELGHKKREGHKPEVYYHVEFESLADQARKEHEKYILETLTNVYTLG